MQGGLEDLIEEKLKNGKEHRAGSKFRPAKVTENRNRLSCDMGHEEV